MQNLTLYLPIRSESLAHYFSRGIVLPSICYENKPADFQNNGKGCLLLLHGKWTVDSDCSLEVFLTEEEKETMIPLRDNPYLFIYAGAIPISRVTGVYFTNKRQSEVTQWNINQGDAFLPNRLIKIDAKTQEFALNGDIKELTDPLAELAEKAYRFDRLLGAVAFFNTAKPATAPFARDYFSIAGYYNTEIRNEYRSAVLKGLAEADEQLLGFLKRDRDSSWKDVYPFIAEGATNGDVIQLGQQYGIKVLQKYGLIDLRSVASSRTLYLVALLATYGPGKPKGIEDLVSGVIANEADEKKAEEIALIFGLHLRYSRLRNKYAARSMVNVKFALESKLDYYVLESVFQTSFMGRTAGQLEYLDITAPMAVADHNEAQTSFSILDMTVPVRKQSWVTQAVGLSVATPNEDKRAGKDESVPAKNIAERGDAFVAAVQAEAKKLVQDIMTEFQAEIRQLRAQITDLRAELDRASQQPSSASKDDLPAQAPTGIDPADPLNKKSFDSLKTEAKKLGIDEKTLKAIKNTREGITTLIELIHSHKLLK